MGNHNGAGSNNGGARPPPAGAVARPPLAGAVAVVGGKKKLGETRAPTRDARANVHKEVEAPRSDNRSVSRGRQQKKLDPQGLDLRLAQTRRLCPQTH